MAIRGTLDRGSPALVDTSGSSITCVDVAGAVVPSAVLPFSEDTVSPVVEVVAACVDVAGAVVSSTVLPFNLNKIRDCYRLRLVAASLMDSGSHSPYMGTPPFDLP